MAKSQVRTKIEEIFKHEFYHVFVDATTPKRKKYRAKFCCSNDMIDKLLTPKNIKAITETIPNIIMIKGMKTNYSYGGILVYFDKKPGDIVLANKSRTKS